jgi:hypothetical protein
LQESINERRGCKRQHVEKADQQVVMGRSGAPWIASPSQHHAGEGQEYGRTIPLADIGQLNDLTGGDSVEARAAAAILVAEHERVATE